MGDTVLIDQNVETRENEKRGSLAQRGSMTLEATIVFPFFMVLLFCLINFINISGRYIAMDHAVSETAKELATHAYPLKFFPISPNSSAEGFLEKLAANPQTLADPKLLEKLRDMVITETLRLVGNELKTAVGKQLDPIVAELARARIKDLYPLGQLKDEDFTIVRTTMYNPVNVTGANDPVNNIKLGNEDVALVVEYKIKVVFPFVPIKEITLSNTAVERAWVD